MMEAYALDRAKDPKVKAAMKALMPALAMPAIPAGELDRITAPTTLIWGRHDRQVGLAVAARAAARHGWPLHVIDDCADDPAVEQPGRFLAVLRSALA